jgi:hypothetical protein
MNVINLYSEMLNAYAEKVGIAPLLTTNLPETEPAPEQIPVGPAPKAQTLYTRIPEPTGRKTYSKPVVLEPSVVEEVRERILSRRRSRFTKEGILNVSSKKITG